MPMLSWIAPTPNDFAMSGSAVAITVPSNVSMKNAAATIRAIRVGRDVSEAGAGDGKAAFLKPGLGLAQRSRDARGRGPVTEMTAT